MLVHSFNKDHCVPDVNFGYVLFPKDKKNQDDVKECYYAVLYFFDHVNEDAYPLFSYTRLELSSAIKAYGSREVKNGMKSVMEVSREASQILRDVITKHLPEMHEPSETRSEVSLEHYNQRIQKLLDSALEQMTHKAERLERLKSAANWKVYFHNPSFSVPIDSHQEFLVFFNKDQKEYYRGERIKNVRLKDKPDF